MTTDHDLHGYRNGMGPCVCAECASLRKDFTPHPDTARADAAERMLLAMMNTLTVLTRKQLFQAVPDAESWWSARVQDEVRKQLTARRDAARAEAARLDAELAAITSASAGPAAG